MNTEQLYTLTADDILDKLAAVESQIEDLTAQKTAYREVLTTFYKDGTINDKLDNGNGYRLNWTSVHTSYKYSDALTKQIKTLKQQEEYEGIAIKKVTFGWKKQTAKPKF